MAIRFSSVIKDAKGNNVFVDIYDDDYTGSVMDITLGEQGINIRQDADDGIYTPVRKRSCELGIVTDDPEYFVNVFARPNKISVSVISIEYLFYGRLVGDSIGYTTNGYTYQTIKVTFTDWLGMLAKIDFTPITLVPVYSNGDYVRDAPQPKHWSAHDEKGMWHYSVKDDIFLEFLNNGISAINVIGEVKKFDENGNDILTQSLNYTSNGEGMQRAYINGDILFGKSLYDVLRYICESFGYYAVMNGRELNLVHINTKVNGVNDDSIPYYRYQLSGGAVITTTDGTTSLGAFDLMNTNNPTIDYPQFTNVTVKNIEVKSDYGITDNVLNGWKALKDYEGYTKENFQVYNQWAIPYVIVKEYDSTYNLVKCYWDNGLVIMTNSVEDMQNQIRLSGVMFVVLQNVLGSNGSAIKVDAEYEILNAPSETTFAYGFTILFGTGTSNSYNPTHRFSLKYNTIESINGFGVEKQFSEKSTTGKISLLIDKTYTGFQSMAIAVSGATKYDGTNYTGAYAVRWKNVSVKMLYADASRSFDYDKGETVNVVNDAVVVDKITLEPKLSSTTLTTSSQTVRNHINVYKNSIHYIDKDGNVRLGYKFSDKYDTTPYTLAEYLGRVIARQYSRFGRYAELEVVLPTMNISGFLPLLDSIVNFDGRYWTVTNAEWNVLDCRAKLKLLEHIPINDSPTEAVICDESYYMLTDDSDNVVYIDSL